ncbi:putative muramidase [Pseudomonas phage phiZ98]|nr:putative muramidase [Pseudomonas phage phiZ98]
MIDHALYAFEGDSLSSAFLSHQLNQLLRAWLSHRKSQLRLEFLHFNE